MTTTNKTTVILADDHPIVIDGVKEILKTMDYIVITSTANNGTELLQLIHQAPPDLAIIDVNMPGIDGIQCTRLIKKDFPSTKVLILTMYNDPALFHEMIQVGADGCLLKSKGSEELREAITRVLQEKKYFDFVLPRLQANDTASLNLTDREIEIIKLMVKGKSSLEIADLLFISEHTVKTHKKNIFKKLNINASAQLTPFALAHGWA